MERNANCWYASPAVANIIKTSFKLSIANRPSINSYIPDRWIDRCIQQRVLMFFKLHTALLKSVVAFDSPSVGPGVYISLLQSSSLLYTSWPPLVRVYTVHIQGHIEVEGGERGWQTADGCNKRPGSLCAEETIWLLVTSPPTATALHVYRSAHSTYIIASRP